MENVNSFTQELGAIRDLTLRIFVKECLTAAPEYFWIMAASTTGKYHPTYCLGEGGLIRHTKAAVKIAISLLALEQYAHLDSDCIIAALILHDSVKQGKKPTGYSVAEHPLAAAEFIQEVFSTFISVDKGELEFKVHKIENLIRSHMGQWNQDYHKRDILPKPITQEEQFVHLCDYLASRKFLICEVE